MDWKSVGGMILFILLAALFLKAFQLQRSSVNRFAVGDHGEVWSIQRHHQGLLTATLVTLYKILTLTFYLSFFQKHLLSPSPSLALFGGCPPPHSAVLEIKGMSMFIWHTENQSWLNSLTMRQMYCTVARETKLTLGVVLCVKSCQKDTECSFQWGKGQNMRHIKGEDDYLFESLK